MDALFTGLIGSGPIGLVAGLFIHLWMKKDKQIQELQEKRLEEMRRHSDQQHAASMAVADAIRSLAEKEES